MTYTLAWALWLLLVAATFFALELPAVRNRTRRMDTLTENLRRWLGFEPRRWWLQVPAVMVLVGGPLALLLHLFGLI